MAKVAKTPAKKATAKKAEAKKSVPAKKQKNVTAASADPDKTFKIIQDAVEVMKDDLDKLLVNDVKAAGKRVRMGAQTIKKACSLLRKEVQAVVVSLKNKKE